MVSEFTNDVGVIATDKYSTAVSAMAESNFSSTEALHIASLVVHVRPEFLPGFHDQVQNMPNVEIHAENAQGKLVVVLEAESEANIVQVMDEMLSQSGVLNVALVYHEMIEDDEPQCQGDQSLPEGGCHDYA